MTYKRGLITTLTVFKKTRQRLEKKKLHRREPIDETINRILDETEAKKDAT